MSAVKPMRLTFVGRDRRNSAASERFLHQDLQHTRSELEINVIFDIRAAVGRRLEDPPLLKTIEQTIVAADIDPMKKSLADQKSSTAG